MQKQEATRKQLSHKVNSTIKDLNNSEEEEVPNKQMNEIQKTMQDMKEESN
jgi:hypothetical protein